VTTDVAYVALGSNLGDRASHLAAARARLAAVPGVSVLRASAVETTAPIGPAGQGDYLNQMIAVRTTLAPPELLSALHAIERAGGRERRERWGARTIDLDIVAYASTTWTSPHLTVPHPALGERDFWRRELEQVRE